MGKRLARHHGGLGEEALVCTASPGPVRMFGHQALGHMGFRFIVGLLDGKTPWWSG